MRRAVAARFKWARHIALKGFFFSGFFHMHTIRDNHQRQNILDIAAIDADEMQLHILRTHGYPRARVYEVRVY